MAEEEPLDAVGQQLSHFAESHACVALITALRAAAAVGAASLLGVYFCAANPWRRLAALGDDENGGDPPPMQAEPLDGLAGQPLAAISPPLHQSTPPFSYLPHQPPTGEELPLHTQATEDVTKLAPQHICARVEAILQPYQEQSHLLDPHLDAMIAPLLATIRDPQVAEYSKNVAFRLLYVLTKIRGFKTVVKHFSHEATDLHYVLQLLEAQDVANHELWCNRYILLLWLSLVCMLPFNMAVFEDSAHPMPLVERILALCHQYLGAADLTHVAAAQLAARLVTRPDTREAQLPRFIDWCIATIRAHAGQTSGSAAFKVSGALGALATVFKVGRRDDLLPQSPHLLSMIADANLPESSNTLTRKLTSKLVQRIGMTFLPPRLASWRYQRGQRMLALNVAKGSTGNQQAPPPPLPPPAPVDDDISADVPAEMEQVIQLLMTALADKDTVVRWSAAKGVGRVTGRLPQDFADQVLESLLDLFSLRHSDGAWHGGCLALAELSRRGLLLPPRLPQVVPVVIRALNYDEIRGATSVGAHVRDAASYVCWAFARAYDPSILQAFVQQLAAQLVVTAVFDRECNVRRAAAAAFQENVGRLGTVPHGIAVIGLIDYFSVGNRSHAFLHVALGVGQFPEYHSALIAHLVDVKMVHWDPEIRVLTAQALGRLGRIAPHAVLGLMKTRLLPTAIGIDLNGRHGAILALGQVAAHLYDKDGGGADLWLTQLDAGVVLSLADLIQKLEAHQYFRGMGGALVHTAACHYLRDLATARFPLEAGDNPTRLSAYLAFLRQSLEHVDDNLRKAAVEALTATCGTYLVDQPRQVFEREVLQPLLTSLQAARTRAMPSHRRLGVAKALGLFPPSLARDFGQVIATALIDASQAPDLEAESMAEARAAALEGLIVFGLSVLLAEAREGAKTLAHGIYQAMLDGLGDYSTDRRGDVGSIARGVAMEGLAKLTAPFAAHGPIDAALFTACVQGLLKQLMEKIDRVRQLAGETLMKLIVSSEAVPDALLVDHDALKNLLRSQPITLDWSVSSLTFPLLIPLLAVDLYAAPLLSGLIQSMGGMTESLVRQSTHAFISFAVQQDVHLQEKIACLLVDVGQQAAKDDRVVIPLFKTLQLACTHGCFDSLAAKADESFSVRAVNLVKDEIKNCTVVAKLIEAAGVFCELLNFSAARRAALIQLSLLLCHKFPRVRRQTAETLYVAVLSLDDAVPAASENDVLAKLASTPWDTWAVADLRAPRDAICKAAGVPAPVVTKAAAPSSASAVRKPAASIHTTGLDTYKDLVERTGY